VTPDPLSDVPAQLAACRTAIAAVDAREAAHHENLTVQIGRLAGLAGTVSRALAEGSAGRERLDDLDRQVGDLARQRAQPPSQDDRGRRPPAAAQPAPGESADGDPAGPEAVLGDWVERVYRPGYGHLAVLGPCWPQHELCLYGLDILRRLWSALYSDPDPDPDADSGPELLSAQAEYQARILPVIAAQLAAETTRCGHPTLTSYPGARQ
jgi:hypothetical protein